MMDAMPDEPRYLMNGTPFSSFEDLTDTIEQICAAKDNDSAPTEKKLKSDASTKSLLPKEIVEKIAMYFTVTKLDPCKTRVLGCSSSSNQHDLKECLVDSSSSWWISAYGSLENGVGAEYIEFELSSSTMVRLSAVCISIPMLPMGPLSVRTMRLDGLDRGQWKAMTPILEVENVNGWQKIALERPIDTQIVRLVCLSNQSSRYLDGNNVWALDLGISSLSSVGFFTVRFE